VKSKIWSTLGLAVRARALASRAKR